jgi:hypothetical protein
MERGCAEPKQRCDVDTEVVRGERGKPCDGGAEDSGGRCEAATMMRVIRVLMLLAEVDQCPGDLDERFVEFAVGAVGFQPKVLKHIVGLVVVAAVEAFEIAEVARIGRGVCLHRKRLDEGGDAVGFFGLRHGIIQKFTIGNQREDSGDRMSPGRTGAGCPSHKQNAPVMSSEMEAVIGGGFAEDLLAFAVGGEVGEAVVDVLGVGIDFGGDGFGVLEFGGEVAAHGVECFEEHTCGLFPRFDAGLVVGVDVDE